MTTKRWTLAEIRAANEAAGYYFFSPATMKGFGDTMRNFGVVHRGGKVYVRRNREARNAPRGYRSVGELREFDPETGAIGLPIKPEMNHD